MIIRQQLVECLDFALRVEQLGDEITARQQRLIYMQSDENRYENRMSFFRGICLAAMGFCALFIGVGVALNGVANMLRLLGAMLAVPTDPTGCITWLVVIGIVCSGMGWILSASKLHRTEAENKIKRQEIDMEIRELQDRMRDDMEFGYREGYFSIVPMDYFGSEMLRYCISVVDRRLANTMQEVFLLLEQELRRQEQMEHQQMLYEAQAEQMERLTHAVNVNTMATILLEQERRK